MALKTKEPKFNHPIRLFKERPLSVRGPVARWPLEFHYKFDFLPLALIFSSPLFVPLSLRDPRIWHFQTFYLLLAHLLQRIFAVDHRETMFHMRKPSNTRSTPVVFSSKPTKPRLDHKQRTSIHLGTDVCACRDTSPSSNHTRSASTAKPPKTSTKPLHRRARPSIDKSQVSKPFPILTHDERDLFDVMASGSVHARTRGIPKAAEKKVKINAPELIRSSPQPKVKVPSDTSPRSWYTPVSTQSPARSTLQRSVSNATPQTPSKVDLGRANSTKEFRTHNSIEPTKRRVHKHLITHSDCPWLESKDNPYVHHGYPTQHRPVRSATRGSYESDKTAVEDEASTHVDVKGQAATFLAKPVQGTLRPTVRLISKPLPGLPDFDSRSSRWSASTSSSYSDCDPFWFDQVLDQFPGPPKDTPNMARFDDGGNSSFLPTPPVFMSCSNSSSGSVATITPTVTPDPSPLTLKAVQKPKVVTVVHQIPHASYSYAHLQDSIVIRDGRAYPEASMKGSIHSPSIRNPGATPTLRRRSSSFTTPTQSQDRVNRLVKLEALVRPWYRHTPEDIERLQRAALELDRKYEAEAEKEREHLTFCEDFGVNPNYRGKKSYEQEAEKPENTKKQRRWL